MANQLSKLLRRTSNGSFRLARKTRDIQVLLSGNPVKIVKRFLINKPVLKKFAKTFPTLH